jgi:hypothetical protein
MIPVTLLELTIRSVDDAPVDLGANPGSSLRGALYEALAAMYDTGDPARSRDDLETNPVAWLLRLEDAQVSGGHDVPRPISIRPPLANHSPSATFGLAFYGRGRTAIPMVLSAVYSLQNIGMGRGRRPFRVVGVSALDPLSRQATPLLDAAGRPQATAPEPLSPAAFERFAALLDPNGIAIDFLTPTRILREGHLCKEPLFVPWFQRLLERLRVMSEVYSTPVWIPFRELLEIAAGVTVAQDATRWQEAWSYSRYEGRGKPTSGFVGYVQYVGPLERLLPYLLIGQALQVGKNTVKGCGWYQIHYRWRG